MKFIRLMKGGLGQAEIARNVLPLAGEPLKAGMWCRVSPDSFEVLALRAEETSSLPDFAGIVLRDTQKGQPIILIGKDGFSANIPPGADMAIQSSSRAMKAEIINFIIGRLDLEFAFYVIEEFGPPPPPYHLK